MMQAYALQETVARMGHAARIINFSNEGQRRLYSVLPPMDSVKNVVKNAVLFPHRHRVADNFSAYEGFMSRWFNLDGPVRSDALALTDEGLDVVIAGSDQVWNITIEDGDDAYYLPWVQNAKKVAYAPSFGAKDPAKYADDSKRYANFIRDFNAVSIRERNGQGWVKSLTGIDVPVLIDPTLQTMRSSRKPSRLCPNITFSITRPAILPTSTNS